LWKQAQCSVIHTIGQRVEVMRDTEQGATQRIAMHRGNLLRTCGKLAQHGCQFGTKYRHTIQADHLQNTQQTAQFGTGCLQSHHIGFRGSEIPLHLRSDHGQSTVQSGFHGGQCVAVKLCFVGHGRFCAITT